LAHAPILLAAGEADPMVPVKSAHALAQMLAQCRAAVDFAVMESGHDLTPEDFSGAKRWFAGLA
jgi:predicted esterase